MLLKSLGFALGFVAAPLLLEVLSLAKMVWVFHGTLISASIFVLIFAAGMQKKGKRLSQSA